MAWLQCDYALAIEFHGEALGLYRNVGDKEGIGFALNNLGAQFMSLGDNEQARLLYEESLAIRRESGDRWGIAQALGNLGCLALSQRDYRSAQELTEESLMMSREAGDRHVIALSLVNLGLAALNQCDYTSARNSYEESLMMGIEVGDKWNIATCFERFATLNGREGKPEQAMRLWGAAERLREEIGSPLPSHEQDDYDRDVAAAREALSVEASSAAWTEGRTMSMEQAIKCALSEADATSP